MHSSTLLAPVLLLTSVSALPSPATLSTESEPLPLIIWHGLGDNYAADGLAAVAELASETNPGTFVYQIRLDEDAGSDRTATFFGNTTDQIAQVCADLASHPILSTAPAVNALGFSQGGQFLRGFIERCNVPPVRNLVTFGSQHNGIAEFQACGATDWLCKGAMALLRTNTWSNYVQSHLVPAQYYRSCNTSTGEPTEEYLEHSNFLADINNERAIKNETYAKNLASLEKFVMYLFEDDTTVIPKASGWFAQVTNLTSGVVEPLRNRTIYKEDWIGLKKLDEKGGLVFKETEGGHMQLTDKVLIDVFKTYYGPVHGKSKELTVQKEGGQIEL
ncbi:palmitoyl-protein thioesterase precursor [Mytilinidion resinicola]|uniref:Palmitoyl-protein thioesterase 1 n=1 Tax=Mytilinidion resinicola TaxID=574789 RepID=A0A6A6Y573_9PEZI|nr:palmitoyl-protein thioesterase precursor [Mytilinidion resinicola]KAF2802937.1 palmitoyl-protein thioesterase precursor [Mytilinidion resinicola]